MTDTNSALADEAAQDNDGLAMQDGFMPRHAGETNPEGDFERDEDNLSETEPPSSIRGMIPLEQVTDWAELERRLHHPLNEGSHNSDTAPLGVRQNRPPGEPENGELPPETPLPSPDNPDDPNAPAAPRGLPRNYRLHTQDPQRARFYQLLRQHPEANPADLARAAGYGEAPEDATTGEAPAEGAPNPKHDAEPQAVLRETIADLAQRRRACRAAYDFEQADALTEQLQAAQAELENHEQTAAQAEDAQADYVAAYREARDLATDGHPALAEEGTRQNRLARLLIAAKEQQSPEFFSDPAYPLRLVRELEQEFPEAFPRRAGGDAPRLVTRSRPLGEAIAGATGGSRGISRGQLERQIDQLSAEQLFALAHRVGTSTGGWE